MLKNMDELYDYVYSFINIEKGQKLNKKTKEVYTLKNINEILKHFNNPQENQKIIHVSGTKGKGSVTLLISHLLKRMKFNVSTFISPHLININERFLNNLNEISDEELLEITNEVKTVIDENNLLPTTFELLFVVFLLFAGKKKSDYLVIEVGLGGRLDTTNIVLPLISVITPVSFDHTNILGKRLKDIAYEKAGIIKENREVVISRQKKSAREILVQKAKESNSKLYDVKNHFKLIEYRPKADGVYFDFKFNNIIIKDFYISLLGSHQIDNFFSALLSVYLIDNSVLDIIDKSKKFIVKVPCRIELVQKNIPVIIDVSHNRDSANKLKKTLIEHFPEIRKWIILSSLSVNKDYKGFYKELSDIAELLIITSPSRYKEAQPEKVYSTAKKIFNNTIFIKDQEEAYKKALSYNLPLLVTGSFYLAGPILEKWKIK